MLLVFIFFVLFLAIIGVVWRRRHERSQRQRMIRQLRQWIGRQTEIDPQLQRWINGLSITETEVLLDLLNGYCTSLNWELAWLFAPHLDKSPILKQAIEEGLVAYACSILASLQLHEDMCAHKAYLGLLKQPTGRKEFTLVQKLHTDLTTRGLIKAAPKQRRWFKRGPTRKQQVTSVMQAFEQEPGVAMEALKTLLRDEGTADVEHDRLARVLPLSTAAGAAA